MLEISNVGWVSAAKPTDLQAGPSFPVGFAALTHATAETAVSAGQALPYEKPQATRSRCSDPPLRLAERPLGRQQGDEDEEERPVVPELMLRLGDVVGRLGGEVLEVPGEFLRAE